MTTSIESAIAELASPHHDAEGVLSLVEEAVHELSPAIVFDPVVHIQSGAEVGAEALARFPGSVSPADWFRSAHAVGAGVDLELRVLHAIIGQLDGRVGFVGANLSPEALMDPRCIDVLDGVEGAELVVEITNQTTSPAWPVMRTRLDQVRNRGVRVGMHVAELTHDVLGSLMQLQPDVVKFDRDLTAALGADRVSTTAADNVFRFCRHEGVFIVAVGVEHQAELGGLRDRGVDATQGVVHSIAPVLIPEFEFERSRNIKYG